MCNAVGDRRLWRISRVLRWIHHRLARGSVYKPLRLVKGRMDRRLGNRRRFFRATGFEIGNATGRAQRKLAKKESRPQSRSLPILPPPRDPLDPFVWLFFPFSRNRLENIFIHFRCSIVRFRYGFRKDWRKIIELICI